MYKNQMLIFVYRWSNNTPVNVDKLSYRAVFNLSAGPGVFLGPTISKK